MKRCGIYVRVASIEQAGGEKAFAVQEAAGIALCQKKGWKFEVFRETGMSGSALRKLVELVKARKLNYVFVNTWDRLSRNFCQLIAIKERIEQSGASIVTAETSSSRSHQLTLHKRSASGEFIEEIADAIRRYEYALMAERRWALRQRKERP